MDLKPNLDAADQIRAADMRGVPLSQLKDLYIKQNCFGLDPDSSIHRVIEVKYLLEDVENGWLTHPRAGGETWGDANENPLLQHQFSGKDGVNLGAVFRGIARDIYAQCWTVDEDETKDAWARFSRGNEAVRISSTPRKLLSRLMNTTYQFYGLSHFIGRIHYTGSSNEQWLEGTEITDFMDTLGQALVLSTHILPDNYRSEKEARLIYFEHSLANHVLTDAQDGIVLRRLAFDWPDGVDELILGPTVSAKTKTDLEELFARKGIECPIKRSAFTAELLS